MKTMVTVLAVMLVIAGCGASVTTRNDLEWDCIDVDSGFRPYIVSIHVFAEDATDGPVMVWFSRDLDKASAGLLSHGVKLTIFEWEYEDAYPCQRRVMAEDRLIQFLNAVQLEGAERDD